jgi:hypothetical protein
MCQGQDFFTKDLRARFLTYPRYICWICDANSIDIQTTAIWRTPGLTKNVYNIPSNILGVPYVRKPAQAYENANHAVDELLQSRDIVGSKFIRRLLEYIASENLNGHFPTSMDIANHFLEYNREYLKKALTALRKRNLILIEGNVGKFDELVLANILPEKKTISQLQKKELTPDILEFQIRVLKEFIEMKAPLLHHIKLLCQLKEKADYYSIVWPIRSSKNQSKVFEKRLSSFRKFTISINRTGTVVIDISCSKDPFDICSIEGITEFYAVCGEILGEIRNGTNRFLTNPLTADVPDWILSQCDQSFDIPTGDIDFHLNTGALSNGTFSWKFDGCMKVKYLSHLIQMYVKDTKHGRILRIEDRLSHSIQNAPTISEKGKQMLINLLDNVFKELKVKDLDNLNSK